MSKWEKEKQRVLEAAREMLNKGLVVGTSGNVSQRLTADANNQLIAITPSGIAYDSMKAEDIQVVDFQEQTVEGNLTPSTETRLHLAIYKFRDNINAVIHTHSVFASAVSVTGADIPPIMEDQIALLGGEIKLVKHAVSGSPEQVDYVLAALEDRHAVLLPNHGAVATGRTIREAFTACELIEKTAKIYILAKLSGEVNRLPPEIMEAMKTVYKQAH
jgi:L-fuculose-phosphate aldolase